MSSSKQDFVAQVFGRYTRDLVKYFTRRVGSRVDARDLAQDAYVRLLRVDKVDLIRDPQSYLFRIAANVAYEYQIKQRNERARLEDPQLAADLDHLASMTLEEEADVAERVAHLNAVLATLAPKHRLALILHRQQGMTYEEIAGELDVSIHTVKKYISVGLAQCRDRLRGAGEQS